MNAFSRLTIALLLTAASLGSPARAADLEREFRSPPDTARPATWWRWINGNISREGITRDLQEMSRQGIRQVTVFDVGAPRMGLAPVPGMGMMSPRWREMFHFALEEAKRFGLEVRLSPAAGWGIGGPWVDSAHAARTIRAVTVQVEGGRPLDLALPRADVLDNYYHDIAVLAVPEKSTAPADPLRITASSSLGGNEDEKNWPVEDVFDRDPQTYWKTAEAPSPSKPAWVDFEYPEAIEMTSLLIAAAPDAGPRRAELQAADDRGEFHSVTSLDLARGESKRIEFAAARAKKFRLLIPEAYAPDVRLAELQLLRRGDEPILRPGIKWWRFKAAYRAFAGWPEVGPAVLPEEYPDQDHASDYRLDQVRDLTAQLSPDGHLHWDAPPGRWTVLRFGLVLVGEPPRVSSESLTGGYEADPFSGDAAQCLYDNTAGLAVKDAGPLAGHTLIGIDIDSYEIGASVKGWQGNWTDNFRAQFQQSRGYDVIKFLPALTGRIVDSRLTTDRFLWDFRHTLAELYLQFYERFAQLAHRDGLRVWAENGYGTYPFPHIDGLASFGRADVPMGEFWYARDKMSRYFSFCDSVRTAASGAHVYGRTLVAAECATFANGILQAPGDWKATLDREFCNGMNAPTLNCWSLQYDTKARPGLYTYDMANENMTWWNQSGPFFDYLGRCSRLLQQGTPVADVLYFRGEDTCTYVPSRDQIRPELPAGCEFDAISPELLETQLAVRDGRLVLPSGTRYRYLVAPATPGWMATPELLRKLAALVRDGATLIGPRPGSTPTLRDVTAAESEVTRLIDELWGPANSAAGLRTVGRGRVISGQPLAAIMAGDHFTPDLAPQHMTDAANLLWCHRRDGDTDLYFLSNQAATAQTGEIAFRDAHGRQPEFWDPVSGEIRPARAFTSDGTRTTVPLELAASGSLFVLFRHPAPAAAPAARGENFPAARPLATLSAPWTVQFDPHWAGPAQPVTFASLRDWAQSEDPALQDYSGTAVYRTRFDLTAESLAAGSLDLNLGQVKNIAHVRLNGHDLGIVWTAPWKVRLGSAAQAGPNDLEIEVANLWTNRLLHDQIAPPDQRLTSTTLRKLKQDTPRSPSGLLGPVVLESSPAP